MMIIMGLLASFGVGVGVGAFGERWHQAWREWHGAKAAHARWRTVWWHQLGTVAGAGVIVAFLLAVVVVSWTR